MQRTLTEEQDVGLARLLILMDIPKEMALEIITAIETPQELLSFLDKLDGRLYEMTPEEVYEAAGETVTEFQHA